MLNVNSGKEKSTVTPIMRKYAYMVLARQKPNFSNSSNQDLLNVFHYFNQLLDSTGLKRNERLIFTRLRDSIYSEMERRGMYD